MDNERIETAIFVAILVAIGVVYMWDKAVGNLEATIYRHTGITDMGKYAVGATIVGLAVCTVLLLVC